MSSTESFSNYNDLEKKGLLDVLFVNKGTSLEYKINKETLKFSSFEKKNNYNGLVEFKPFYLNANLVILFPVVLLKFIS